MTPHAPEGRSAHPLTWAIFIALLAFAAIFILRSAAELPPRVASHFDAGGAPNAFMTRSTYTHFVLLLGVAMPVGLVALLTAVYSRAQDFKLPNRDYWTAPERLRRTRSLLIAHGVWFGSLLVMLVCFVHRLELTANRQQPAHLSSQTIAIGLIVFMFATGVWVGSLIFTFRRPNPD